MTDPSHDFRPTIRTAGIDGLLVSFGDRLTEPANRAALAFRAAVDAESWSAVQETSTSLVSTYIRFDLAGVSHAALQRDVNALLQQKDWLQSDLPTGRSAWRIPTVFGGDHAPQLAEAAALTGQSEADAVASLSNARVRVQTIGFAPGQPYLGELPEIWDIPRQTTLTKRVPEGALTVAIRQLVLFSISAPTGWRHIGQTAFQAFRPDAADPFVLRPGDDVQFVPVTPDEFANLSSDDMGGATRRSLP